MSRIDPFGIELPPFKHQRGLFEGDIPGGRIPGRQSGLGHFIHVSSRMRPAKFQRWTIRFLKKRQGHRIATFGELKGVTLRPYENKSHRFAHKTPMPPQLAVMVLNFSAVPALTNIHSSPIRRITRDLVSRGSTFFIIVVSFKLKTSFFKDDSRPVIGFRHRSVDGRFIVRRGSPERVIGAFGPVANRHRSND